MSALHAAVPFFEKDLKMKEYHSIRELFAEAERLSCSPGIVACRAEAAASGMTYEETWAKMRENVPVFKHSVRRGLADRSKSPSGMVGGDAHGFMRAKMKFLSPLCQRAVAFALAVAEANAKMYCIVACPTAGSCGIVPAVLATIGYDIHPTDDEYTRALFVAGAVGKIVAEKGSIAGAVGGCQAECGTAIAMAAAAGLDLLGCTTRQMEDAIALGLKNILGLVCDPVAGLVEVPCVKRNGFDAVIALTAMEMALAGMHSVIPADEVIEAMGQIGKLLPESLRETSLAGLAVTPTAQRITEEMEKK